MGMVTGCEIAEPLTGVEFRFTNECADVVQVWTEGNYVACQLGPGESKDDNCGAGAFPVQGSFRVSREVLRLEFTEHMPGDPWQQNRFDFLAGTVAALNTKIGRTVGIQGPTEQLPATKLGV
ncbi:hypothetical protein H257_05572 [Aphanomyces astaci]|uniref:Uncharacterized protein n=1 Tax=Aphanomyces astaci TaxID=112090 RepID=W4GT72_APHAT|nr:hypothetical protein H257_05572 [Aphanomyces astaci]ETV82053.1 hypothetical protein H257_05572 [Aphanomyces astaci]|eukprot:XP_009828790.1 hypothetical protein H257_05572 [Aphanomyces astaci]